MVKRTKQIVCEWTTTTKWAMTIVCFVIGSFIVGFTFYVANGSTDGQKALREFIKLEKRVTVNEKEGVGFMLDVSRKLSKFETNLDNIKEDTKEIKKEVRILIERQTK